MVYEKTLIITNDGPGPDNKWEDAYRKVKCKVTAEDFLHAIHKNCHFVNQPLKQLHISVDIPGESHHERITIIEVCSKKNAES